MPRQVTMARIRRNFPMGVLDRLPGVQGALNRGLEALLGLRHIDEHIGRAAHLECLPFIRALMEDLEIRYDVPAADRARVPRTGPVVVTSNHPTGITELALFNYLATIRPDLRIVINETLLDIAANARKLVIPLPVFNRRDPAVQAEIRGRIREALGAGMLLLFFPSGVISNRVPGGGLEDPEWKKGALHAARDTGAPILPVHVGARNSAAFYRLRGLPGVGETLSWTLLFREYMKHRGGLYPIRVGELIPPTALRPGEALDGADLAALNGMIRSRTDALGAHA
jgi:putative hemolysin